MIKILTHLISFAINARIYSELYNTENVTSLFQPQMKAAGATNTFLKSINVVVFYGKKVAQNY